MTKIEEGTSADKEPPSLDTHAASPAGGHVTPISVNFGPAYRAQYTTTQYDRPVEISLEIDIRAVWEAFNEGHHWMQLTVWVDGKLHHFSGELAVGEGAPTTVVLPSNKRITLPVPTGKQHVITIQHDNAGAKAIEMNLRGTVERK